MVGHEIGLGDRHGENLLIDTRTGEVAHVDFACLFDKGESLQVPEVVRFRLTPNVVDGLGVAGCHGQFQRSCELTIALCMKHKEMLLGVLQTFIHDPLVEWTNGGTKNQQQSKEIRNGWRNEADWLLGRVAKRLDGCTDLYTDREAQREAIARSGGNMSSLTAVMSKHSLGAPVSVQAQVKALIENSSSLEVTSRCYIWWMCWI
jgi:phosphatidylinositol kinase/protein kinase (PI-3  family)